MFRREGDATIRQEGDANLAAVELGMDVWSP